MIAAVGATQCGPLARLPLFALEVALALVQTQATVTVMPEMLLLLAGSPSLLGTWGLGRSARAEASLPRVCIHAPVTTARSSRHPRAEVARAGL